MKKKIGILVLLVLVGVTVGYVARAIHAPSVTEYGSWGPPDSIWEEDRGNWRESVVRENKLEAHGVWKASDDPDLTYATQTLISCRKEAGECAMSNWFDSWGRIVLETSYFPITNWSADSVEAVMADACGSSTLRVDLVSGKTTFDLVWNMEVPAEAECSDAPPGGAKTYELVHKPETGFNKIRQYFVDTFEIGWDPIVTEVSTSTPQQ